MQRLSDLEEHEIGDVDDVVDGIVTYREKLLLQPLGGRSDLDSTHGNAAVTRRPGRIKHLDGDPFSLAFPEGRDVGHMELAGYIIEPEPCIKVAGDADMRGCIHAVGSDLILNHRLRLKVEIILGRSTHDGLGLENHYAGMVFANAEFICGADHAEGLHSADLGFLDLEITGKDGAESREEDLLSGSDVGGAADHGYGIAVAGIDLGDVEMVRVGMRLALQDLGHDHTGESAGDLFLFLN